MQTPDVVGGLPDFVIGEDPAEAGHPAETDAVLDYPEQLYIGQFLNLGRAKIQHARIHDLADIARVTSIFSVAGSAGHAEEAFAGRNGSGIIGGRSG